MLPVLAGPVCADLRTPYPYYAPHPLSSINQIEAKLTELTAPVGWEFVSINAGYATSGLFINGTQLQWTAYDSFGGWLVCDWWHGIPQLFWKVDYLNYPVSSCAAVELITEETTGAA